MSENNIIITRKFKFEFINCDHIVINCFMQVYVYAVGEMHIYTVFFYFAPKLVYLYTAWKTSIFAVSNQVVQ